MPPRLDNRVYVFTKPIVLVVRHFYRSNLPVLLMVKHFNCTFLLKYGFCKKALWKNATLISWTHFSSQKGTCSTIQVPFCDEKSVQLFRVAFFRSDFLQNPYFSSRFDLIGSFEAYLAKHTRAKDLVTLISKTVDRIRGHL